MSEQQQTTENAQIVADGLRRLADDQQALWEVARQAIEDALIEWRDDRLSMLGRNNGFVVKEKDGTDSSIIRFGPEVGVRIALLALADHLSLPPGLLIVDAEQPVPEMSNTPPASTTGGDDA